MVLQDMERSAERQTVPTRSLLNCTIRRNLTSLNNGPYNKINNLLVEYLLEEKVKIQHI